MMIRLNKLLATCLGTLGIWLCFAGASPAQSTGTVPLYQGNINMGGGFSLDMELTWDYAKGHIRSRGTIAVAGQTLLVSQADGYIVDGNALEIKKSWNGASGLRVDTVLRLKPGAGRYVDCTLHYHAYNKRLKSLGLPDPLAQRGTKTARVNVASIPWQKGGTGGTPAVGTGGRKQPIYVQNKTGHKLWVAVHYMLHGAWKTQGFTVLEPGQKVGPICYTDNRQIYFYANGPDRRPVWSGGNRFVVQGETYGFVQRDTGASFDPFTYSFSP